MGTALLLHAASERLGAEDTAMWLRRLVLQSNQVGRHPGISRISKRLLAFIYISILTRVVGF